LIVIVVISIKELKGTLISRYSYVEKEGKKEKENERSKVGQWIMSNLQFLSSPIPWNKWLTLLQ
jgi:hypothetical protein